MLRSRRLGMASRCGRPISFRRKARSTVSTCAGSASSITTCVAPSGVTRRTRFDTTLVIQAAPASSSVSPSGKVPRPNVATVSRGPRLPSTRSRKRERRRPEASRSRRATGRRRRPRTRLCSRCRRRRCGSARVGEDHETARAVQAVVKLAGLLVEDTVTQIRSRASTSTKFVEGRVTPSASHTRGRRTPSRVRDHTPPVSERSAMRNVPSRRRAMPFGLIGSVRAPSSVTPKKCWLPSGARRVTPPRQSAT